MLSQLSAKNHKIKIDRAYYFTLKKKKILAICHNMNGLWGYYAK